MPDYEFVPFVLTNHAKERMELRSITASMISHALANPHSIQDESDESVKYIRFTDGRQLHVIAFYNPNQKKWIVKTVYVRGESDPSLKWITDLFKWIGRLFEI